MKYLICEMKNFLIEFVESLEYCNELIISNGEDDDKIELD